MALVIPLQAISSQTVGVQLNGQDCTINVYQKFFGVFLDLYVGGTLIIAGVLCLNLTMIVRSLYLGFVGDLVFLDNQGTSNPTSTGLGSRFSLLYLAPSDIAGLSKPVFPEES